VEMHRRQQSLPGASQGIGAGLWKRSRDVAIRSANSRNIIKVNPFAGVFESCIGRGDISDQNTPPRSWNRRNLDSVGSMCSSQRRPIFLEALHGLHD